MEASVVENEAVAGDVYEVRVISGLSPEDVEGLLNMAETSGLFNPDQMTEIEDMSWGCAYQGESVACSFLQALVSTPQGEKPIGFLCFTEIPEWPQNYELFGIAVTPEYQRLGIGTALMTGMKNIVAGQDGKRIFLETGQNHKCEEIRRFYEANNYSMEHRFFKQFIPKDENVVYCHTIEFDEEDANFQ
ncbi:GNAT family N-acetyltransferase [uncultured Pseudodesulfovibrio sp.]|uniref:GNAT family N-acetyltransferase n=1 Tax=uncultured Pseudodesulfovibrio sp. TaxID=2035858 RepID=UPI0029C7ABDF|nr:GNAT family N-acetyltransferase [uncultured Pseudodesulfovibrio sp.]